MTNIDALDDNVYDVVIVGGGPAGASTAIHLAAHGARVLLAEQKKFPRPKLCGEFISPECVAVEHTVASRSASVARQWTSGCSVARAMWPSLCWKSRHAAG